MSLPFKAVDRLFSRMAATYGAEWERMLGNAPLSDVKAAWAHELAGFADKLEMVAWALENLPEKPLNVIAFRNLARRAPVPDAPRLPEPKADAALVKAELAKLGHGVPKPLTIGRVDHKDWARAILAGIEAGHKRTPTVARFAREALGIPQPSFANQ